MKIIPLGVLILQLVMATPAQSQTFDDVEIRVGGFVTSVNGGEKNEGIWYTRTPVVIGRPLSAAWSMRGCGEFGLDAARDAAFTEGATTGWRVETTPIRVVNHVVTFRLRWVRALDNGKESTAVREDVELTLKPGEALTMDRVPVPSGAKTRDGGACLVTAASLRLSVDYYPWEEFDRRLIGAELWLVERLSNGGERSQPLSVRGLPNRAIPFYFDSIGEGTGSLEILGQVVARPEAAALEVSLQVRSRLGDSSLEGRRRGEWPTQWLESVIQVKPDEIVEMALPKLERGSPFADRVFSIRIRARQIR